MGSDYKGYVTDRVEARPGGESIRVDIDPCQVHILGRFHYGAMIEKPCKAGAEGRRPEAEPCGTRIDSECIIDFE